jgi:EmrB/QacA subfamily drug resistance transporter
MEFLDTTIVNVTLPTLATTFHVPTSDVSWIVTSYLLSFAVVIPLSGWLGDRFGTKRTFLAALVFFTLGSALGSVAWNVSSLLVFRVLQGIGGGMLTPVGSAMLYRAFSPHERAGVAALTALPIVIAPTLGPVVGGYLVQYHSWHWIFLINVPVGVVGFVSAARVLHEHREATAGRFDVPGFGLAALALVGLSYALETAGTHSVRDPVVLLTWSIGLVALALFIVAELRVRHPLIAA